MAFTLRLSAEEEQKLLSIMDQEGCKTTSDAVRHCIVEHLPLKSYKDEYQRIKNLYTSLLHVLEQKEQAERTLRAEIAARIAQLDSGEVQLLDGSEALQALKQRSLNRAS